MKTPNFCSYGVGHPAAYYRYDLRREGRCLVASNCTLDFGFDCLPGFYNCLVSNRTELESVVRLILETEAVEKVLPSRLYTAYPLSNIYSSTLFPPLMEDRLTATVLALRRKRIYTKRRPRF